jgi:hypothetical protein
MADPGLLSDDITDDEKRKIAMQSLFGGLLQGGLAAVAAGGRMTDAQRAPMLMQAGAAFGGIGPNAAAMTKEAAQQKLLTMRAEQMKTEMQSQKAFSDKLAGAPGGGVIAQGDANQSGMSLTPDEQSYVAGIPDAKDRVAAYRRIMEQKLIDRKPPAGYRVNADGSLLAIPGGPADLPKVQYREVNGQLYKVDPSGRTAPELVQTGGGKPVDNAARDDLKKVADPAINIGRIAGEFAPEYAGMGAGVFGDVKNFIGRNFADEKSDAFKGANWWQNYQDFANLKRNQLFGSALTATEKSEWDKAMINPGMSPEMIKANLARQQEIAKAAVSRMAHSMKAGGVNPDAIEPLMGMKFSDLPNPIQSQAAPQQQAPQAPLAQGGAAPPSSLLKEGVGTQFGNGQVWTLRGGKPERVR